MMICLCSIAPGHLFHLFIFSEVYRVSILYVEYEIVHQTYIVHPVVTENSPVSVVSANVVDIIVADHEILVLGIDINCPSVYYGSHRVDPERGRMADFIIPDISGSHIAAVVSIVGSNRYGRIGKILEPVPRDEEIRSLAKDDRRIRECQSIVPKQVTGHDRTG